MKKALLLGASVAVLAMPSVASAMDIKISGNVTVDMSQKDAVKIGKNDRESGAALAATALVGTTGTQALAATTAATDLDNGSYVAADVGSVGAAILHDGTTVATHALADAGTWYADDYTDEADDWTSATSGDIDVAVSSKNCCFSYGGNLGLAMSTSEVKTDDANIYISSSTFGRLEFGIDGNGTQGAFDRDVLSAGPANVGLAIKSANEGTNTFKTTDYTEATAAAQVAGANAAALSDAFTKTSLGGTTSVEWTHSLGGLSVAAATDLNTATSVWEASVGYTANVLGNSISLVGALNSADSMAVRAKTSYSGVNLVAGYASDDDDESSMYFGASTTISGFSLSAEVALNEAKSSTSRDMEAFAVGGGTASSENLVLGGAAVDDKVLGVHTADDTQIALNAAYTLAPGLVASAGIAMFDVSSKDIFTLETTTAGATETMSFSNSVDGTEMSARLKLSF